MIRNNDAPRYIIASVVSINKRSRRSLHLLTSKTLSPGQIRALVEFFYRIMISLEVIR